MGRAPGRDKRLTPAEERRVLRLLEQYEAGDIPSLGVIMKRTGLGIKAIRKVEGKYLKRSNN